MSHRRCLITTPGDGIAVKEQNERGKEKRESSNDVERRLEITDSALKDHLHGKPELFAQINGSNYNVLEDSREKLSEVGTETRSDGCSDSMDSLLSSLNLGLNSIRDESCLPNDTGSPTNSILREQEASEKLARQLMEEEAIASYSMGAQLLRQNENELSPEDMAALEVALGEDFESENSLVQEGEEVDDDLTYEAMLQLSEQIGNVKEERWSMVAERCIECLPLVEYSSKLCDGREENDCTRKCLVCQSQYEKGDILRVLPCQHYFHSDCVDEWLKQKDFCPYCRQSIATQDNNKIF